MNIVKGQGEIMFEELSELIPRDEILLSFIQYMTDDQLLDFCQQLKKDYDI